MKRKITIPLLITIIIIGLIYSFFVIYLFRAVTAPNPDSEEYITVTIPEKTSLQKTAEILKEKGLIKNKNAFIIRSFVLGIHKKMNTGTYELSPNMSNDEIINALIIGDKNRGQTVKITFREGMTVEQTADLLEENEVITDKQKFLDICKTAGSFSKSKALEGVNSDENAVYIMEGYLFPDTYEFYKNSNPYDVIKRFVNNFNKVYNEDLEKRTKELGFSKNEVIKIASLIQKEAMEGDFKKVSAVLYNRIQSNTKLQVDSSIRYIINDDNTISLSKEQYLMDSPYNTYLNNGLPPTAICNPGKKAIEAALYPNQRFITDGYMFFCLTEATSNTMAFAKTYDEHLENIKKYKSSWQIYDDIIRNN